MGDVLVACGSQAPQPVFLRESCFSVRYQLQAAFRVLVPRQTVFNHGQNHHSQIYIYIYDVLWSSGPSPLHPLDLNRWIRPQTMHA